MQSSCSQTISLLKLPKLPHKCLILNLRPMKKLVLMLLFTVAMQSQTQNYTSSSEIIANPERGQYHYTQGNSVGIFTPLDKTTLVGYRTNEKITLIWRSYNLDAFKTQPISTSFLNSIQADFNTMRVAGVKCILRFSYTKIDGTDASKSQILAHIEQLKPITQANEDVISNMEAGFIGNYGEWYASINFGQDNLTAQNLADRKEVGLKIMELTPNRVVSFRTPTIQRSIGGNSPVSSLTAYNGSINSRIAAHNDCFLSSPSDYGTYINSTTDYTYLENQSKYTFDGGETCSLTTYSECSNAVYTMNRFHFNYLNTDYNQTVTTNWSSNGCYDEIKRRLGYRFELLNSNITTDNLLTINLQNVGFANIFNERKAYLVLKNTSTNSEYSFQLNTDIRKWQSGTQTQIVQSLNLDIPSGTYQLYLNLPDSQIANPLFSIQCANVGTWDAIKGYNNLNQTFTISSTAVVAPTPITTTTEVPVADSVQILLINNSIITVYNLPTSSFTVKVYNLSGRLKSTSVDISNLKSGYYIVKVYSNGIVYSQKIYKQ